MLFSITFMLPRHRGMGAHRQRPMAHRMPADIQATVPVSIATEVVIWCGHVSIVASGPGGLWSDITTHTGPAVGAHRGHWVPVEHGEVLTKCLGCLHVSHALVRGIGRLETSCCKQRRKFQCITSSQSLITFLGLVIWWWSSHTSLELKAYCVLMCLCLC